jgi:hypothetical protein
MKRSFVIYCEPEAMVILQSIVDAKIKEYEGREKNLRRDAKTEQRVSYETTADKMRDKAELLFGIAKSIREDNYDKF